MKKIIFVLLSILTVLGCGSKNDTATDINGSNLSISKRWSKNNFPLKIYIPNTIYSEYKSGIEASVSDWNSALSQNAFEIVYDQNKENTQWTNYNDAGSDDFFGLYSILKSVWSSYSLSSGVLAITASKYYPNTGEMIHADVLFNENFKFFDIRQGWLCRSASLINNEQKCSQNNSCAWQQSDTQGSCFNTLPLPAAVCPSIGSRSSCLSQIGCGWVSSGNECSVNAAKQLNSIDYRTAFTHELGHFLGLGHTDVSKCASLKNENECSTNQSCQWNGNSCIGDSLSIMAPSISKGEVKNLSQGDVFRINELYK